MGPPSLTAECGTWPGSGFESGPEVGFFSILQIYRPTLVYLAVCFLGSLALDKHLIQALPSVYALQCLTGKVDNYKPSTKNNKNYG